MQNTHSVFYLLRDGFAGSDDLEFPLLARVGLLLLFRLLLLTDVAELLGFPDDLEVTARWLEEDLAAFPVTAGVDLSDRLYVARESDLEADLPVTAAADFEEVLLCCFATRAEVVLPALAADLSVRADETEASGLDEVLCADLDIA